MKKFLITVNGKTYEAEVEEIGGSPSAPRTTIPTPVAVPVPANVPATVTSIAIPTGAETITAPMPGKIMSIKVKVGQAVQAGDIILILEAMKMENELFSGTVGTVKEIRVSEGDAVNPGEVLVVIN